MVINYILFRFYILLCNVFLSNKKVPDKTSLFCQGRIYFRGTTLIYDKSYTLFRILTYSQQLTYAIRHEILSKILFIMPSVVHLIICVLSILSITTLCKCTTIFISTSTVYIFIFVYITSYAFICQYFFYIQPDSCCQ